ncbi:adenylosuccinate synthase [Aequitasia blattaphilus]|uniref:Adenylosuccinate synthetase n=1 Tax=Aequitasia blattaphilus TaxID=2949332 RepID=A0ABT1E5U4_9FIRM|nr:adenylosuccinate synthase [Aequitasia blattaphilus]MCP1101213.1 adenylosuccinate synthase [Aequitasia blattaphilus]MCR8613853.1 adenylosuccinate synthase [Aequitasia blattaphilus]
MVKAVVGANWGDEGKGKITDMLAPKADIVVRFQGGANAGHTIINDHGRFALHTLPSGVCCDNVTNVIGNGVALDIPELFKEVQEIVEKGVKMPNLLVSDRAQIVMSYHKKLDAYEEERLGKNSFGSTKSGIAPFYSDKFAKIGFQVSELFDEEILKDKVKRVVEQKNVLFEHLYHKPLLTEDELMSELAEYRKMVEPFVCDTSLYLNNAIKENKEILLEGQLGSLKDPDHGIYPMVTSSSTLAGYGSIGAGIPPYEIKEIITVCKAYSSAVGAGAFVSEIFGEEADELRKRGGDKGEFGATTGRPRRMGWFDCVASKYGCRIQGTTSVAFTVLDVLGYLDELEVCVGYEIDGEVTTEFPTTARLEKAKPVYKTLPGWKSDIRGITEYEKLPENCRKYIEFVEEQIGYPIKMVSNGPGRKEIIFRNI